MCNIMYCCEKKLVIVMHVRFSESLIHRLLTSLLWFHLQTIMADCSVRVRVACYLLSVSRVVSWKISGNF